MKIQKLFHEYLTDKINASNILQTEMAEELGIASPNLIAMIKKGKTKVPLDKIAKFAKILEIDPAYMLRKALFEYQPELLRDIEQYFGQAITTNEKTILNEIRRLSNNTDPKLASDTSGSTNRVKSCSNTLVIKLAMKNKKEKWANLFNSGP